MSEQLLLSKHTTAEITWLYHEHQADKLLEDESKPQIAYHVHLDLGSKLHQNDQVRLPMMMMCPPLFAQKHVL